MSVSEDEVGDLMQIRIQGLERSLCLLVSYRALSGELATRPDTASGERS